MIKILKETEVTGKAKFIPTLENLTTAIDMASEATMTNAEEQDKILATIDTVMMTLADLMEAMDKLKGAKDESK